MTPACFVFMSFTTALVYAVHMKARQALMNESTGAFTQENWNSPSVCLGQGPNPHELFSLDNSVVHESIWPWPLFVLCSCLRYQMRTDCNSKLMKLEQNYKFPFNKWYRSMDYNRQNLIKYDKTKLQRWRRQCCLTSACETLNIRKMWLTCKLDRMFKAKASGGVFTGKWKVLINNVQHVPLHRGTSLFLDF